MYNKQYLTLCNNLTKFYGKLNGIYPAIVSHNQFLALELIVQLQSDPTKRKLFMVMLMVLEKLSKQKIYFLLDKNTLSKHRTFKVGCRVLLRNAPIHSFLNMSMLYSLPKIINDETIYCNIKHPYVTYKMKKILFHSVFSYDADFKYYSDYYEEATYELTVNVKTVYHNIYINRMLLHQEGFIYMK